VLQHLCFSDKIVAAGASEAVVTALTAHAADAAVVFQGCRAIHTLALAEHVPLVCKPRILRAGSLKACKSAASAAFPSTSRACGTAIAAADALVHLHKLTRHIKQHDVRRGLYFLRLDYDNSLKCCER
jgi:hypothetical protein